MDLVIYENSLLWTSSFNWILLFLTKGLLHAFCHSWMVFFRRGLVVDDNLDGLYLIDSHQIVLKKTIQPIGST